MLLRSKTTLAIPPEVMSVCKTLGQQGFQAFVVGGAVRDLLLARSVSDWDVATDAVPEEVLRLFSHAIPTGIKYGTVTVIAEKMPVEVTTFRSDGEYEDGRRPVSVTFGKSIAEDLARRDFTINAMAYDPREKKLVDPYRGQRDLRRKLLRTVGDPAARFAEDGLRIMRLFRFAATLGFRPDRSALEAVDPGLITPVSRERIRDELNRLLVGPYLREVLTLMYRRGVLAAIFPELTAAAGITQGDYHKYDVLHHSLEAAACIAPQVHLRLAALLHDIGKPATRSIDDKGIHFYGHDQIGSELAEEILRRLKYDKKTIDKVTCLVKWHMFDLHPYSSDKAIRRFLTRVGRDNAADLLELRRADIAATGTDAYQGLTYWTKLKQRVDEVIASENVFSLADLAIDGNDVMKITGISQGPRVGQILQEVYEKVIDDPSLNTREQLIMLLEAYR